jgi:tetratricopeptide (TPR) repeat protein
MTNKNSALALLAVVILLTGSIAIIAQRPNTGSVSVGVNRIEGRVVDQANVAVDGAFVELYDSNGSMVSNQRTAQGGRFSFRGMVSGRYTITVKPFGSNLKQDSKEIEVNDQYSRSDLVIVDFCLMPDRRSSSNETGVVGTIFAQEVPPDAERLYKSGIEKIDSKPDQALADLEEAIKLFPTYFNALAALGKANIVRGKYEIGYPYLLRAIDVNAKCGDCYYSLAIAFYKLDQLAAATKAIDAAVVLQPATPSVRLLQGIVYRLDNNLPEAEKALLMAKSLYKEPNPEVHWQLSLLYNKQNRNSEAADELEQYLKAKPDISEAEKQNVHDLIAKLRKSKQS